MPRRGNLPWQMANPFGCAHSINRRLLRANPFCAQDVSPCNDIQAKKGTALLLEMQSLFMTPLLPQVCLFEFEEGHQ